MDTPPCPQCGGILQLGPGTVNEEYHPGFHTIGTALPRRERTVILASCTSCEFCIEVRP